MATLERCIADVMRIASENLTLEIIVVDDCSIDNSLSIANHLAAQHQELRVLRHARNMGKGAAIRTGISRTLLAVLFSVLSFAFMLLDTGIG
jgi:glycosyltransferase involved in cell wall biosynthesis